MTDTKSEFKIETIVPISTDNMLYTLTDARHPVGIIYFIQKGKPRLKYIPQPDITPYEVSLLFPLFAIANMPNYSAYYDYWGYIESNGLMRHFEEAT